MYDPDFTGPDLDFDLLDFEERDLVEAHDADELRAEVTGLPARPGTRR